MLNQCKWGSCSKYIEDPVKLLEHITTTHILSSHEEIQKCLWSPCSESHRYFMSTKELSTHVRIYHSVLIPAILDNDFFSQPAFSYASSQLSQVQSQGIFENQPNGQPHLSQPRRLFNLTNSAEDDQSRSSQEGKQFIIHACGWRNCNVHFSTYRAICAHVHREHLRDGLECTWERCECKGQPFANKLALSIHLKCHARQKLIGCPSNECCRFFKDKRDLSNHLAKEHHRDLTRCDLCAKDVHSIGDLMKHLRRVHGA